MLTDPFAIGLKQILDADSALNAARLSQKAGLDISTVRKILSGAAKSPKHETCMKIADALGMTLEEVKAGGPDKLRTNMITVPLISFVSAGPLHAGDAVLEDMAIAHVRMAGLPAGDWIAFRIEGESMNRVALPGSIIFVNRRETELVDGGYYVISNADNGEATFKQYFASPMRFAPDSASTTKFETYYPDNPPLVIGRARASLLEF